MHVGLDPRQKATLEEAATGMEKLLVQGELPSTSEMESGLERAKEVLEEQKYRPEISEHGQVLLEKTQAVLDAAETLVVEKNKDDKVQRIAKNIAEAGKEVSADQRQLQQQYLSSGEVASREELMDLLHNTRDVASFIVSNSNFRALLMDLADLVPSLIDKIQERHGESLKRGVRTDLDRKQGEESATLRAAEDVARDLREGRLIDEEFKQGLDDRFSRLLMDLGEKRQYRDSVHGLFTLIDRLQQRAEQSKEAARESIDREQDRLQQIQEDSKALLGEFAGERTVSNFLQEFQNTSEDIRQDRNLRSLLWDLRQFAISCVDQPQRLQDETTRRELSELSDRVVGVFDKMSDKLRGHMDRMFSSGRQMLDNIRSDYELNNLRKKLADLLQEATTDERGLPDLFVMRQSLKDMRDIIVPAVTEQLHNLPLPMIEGRTNTYLYRLENLSLDSAESMPEEFDLRLFNDMSIRQEKRDNVMATIMKLAVQNMKPKLRNFNFYYKRLAFPYIEDEGVASVNVHGEGMWILVDWTFVKEADRPARAFLRNVICKIHKMDITVHEGRHKILDNIVLTVFRGLIKELVERQIERQIALRIQEVNSSLNDVISRNYYASHGKGKLTEFAEAVNVGMKRSAARVMERSSEEEEEGPSAGEKAQELGQELAGEVKSKVSGMAEQWTTGGTETEHISGGVGGGGAKAKIPESVERHPEPPLTAPGIGDTEELMRSPE